MGPVLQVLRGPLVVLLLVLVLARVLVEWLAAAVLTATASCER